jgi:hypothetical protein
MIFLHLPVPNGVRMGELLHTLGNWVSNLWDSFCQPQARLSLCKVFCFVKPPGNVFDSFFGWQ